MEKERKWSLKLSGAILFADVSHFLKCLSVILFIAFHIENVSELSLIK